MNVSSFSVPSSKSLGDTLVRDVVPRSSAPTRREWRSFRTINSQQFNYTEISIPPVDCESSRTKPANQSAVNASMDNDNVGKMSLVEPSGGGSGIDPTDFTTAVEALIRQRRRLYQKNYRKQEREQTGKLENDIRKIREVIAVLAQNIQYLSIGISRSKSRWGAIMNYFRLFRKGFRSHTKTAQKCALHVLQSFMAPNVRDGVVCGPKGVLAGWTMFSLCFDDIYVDLRCLENGPIWNSVVATVITSITISKDSLRLVFPHLIEEQGSDGSNRSGQLLANKLLGQRLVMHGSVVFQWDNEMDRVSSMQSRSDLLTPLLRVLGNLEDVNRVLKGSLMTPDCTWPYNVQEV